jgi:hypothetical protein
MLRNQCPLIDISGIGFPSIAAFGGGENITTLLVTVTVCCPILGSFMDDVLNVTWNEWSGLINVPQGADKKPMKISGRLMIQSRFELGVWKYHILPLGQSALYCDSNKTTNLRTNMALVLEPRMSENGGQWPVPAVILNMPDNGALVLSQSLGVPSF